MELTTPEQKDLISISNEVSYSVLFTFLGKNWFYKLRKYSSFFMVKTPFGKRNDSVEITLLICRFCTLFLRPHLFSYP